MAEGHDHQKSADHNGAMKDFIGCLSEAAGGSTLTLEDISIESMRAWSHVSIELYLLSSYEPDAEYVDGEIEKRPGR